jgi:uncharacterized protein with HEPN domain
MFEEKEKWLVKLEHALRAIDDIQKYLSGFSYETFARDRMRMQAVERNLEIIGEAINHIPEDIQRLYPHISWSDIYGMRNILSHGYDIIDTGTVWETATGDLNGLKDILLKIQELS